VKEKFEVIKYYQRPEIEEKTDNTMTT